MRDTIRKATYPLKYQVAAFGNAAVCRFGLRPGVGYKVEVRVEDFLVGESKSAGICGGRKVTDGLFFNSLRHFFTSLCIRVSAPSSHPRASTAG